MIREAITNSGMNNRELARAAGINEGSLSLFIHKKRGLTLKSVNRLAEALGLELVKKNRR